MGVSNMRLLAEPQTGERTPAWITQRLLADADSVESLTAYWRLLMETVGTGAGARRVLLMVSTASKPWQALAQWPETATASRYDPPRLLRLLQQADPPGSGSAVIPGTAATPRWSMNEAGPSVMLELGQVDSEQDTQWLFLVALWDGALPTQWTSAALDAWLVCLGERSRRVLSPNTARTIAPAPDPTAAVPDGAGRAERLFDILQLTTRLGLEPRFLQMAFALCNELVCRFDLDRVSLGWVEGPYIRLRAISHVEKFDPKSVAVRALESAMEEAMDQQVMVYFPTVESQPGVVSRAHESYARTQAAVAMVSVPLIEAGEVHAVLSLESRAGAIDADTCWEAQLVAQATLQSLRTRQHQDRWFGARVWHTLRRWRDGFFGPTHSAWKLAGVVFVLLLAWVSLMPWQYRIEAQVALRSQDVVHVPAPFDAYLAAVHVAAGDPVRSGQLLLELDTRELLLEQAMAEADVVRFQREAEKAQALRELAEMRINLARQVQAAAQLERINYQLAHARLTAPGDGFVTEGDLARNLGAPLRKGDLLLKLALTEALYLELKIDQVDVHEIHPQSQGEFILVGRPNLQFALFVDRIDPVAVTEGGQTFYIGRASIAGSPQAWWRPGMEGSARIEVGERRLIWVMTHRTVRFLRQVFWL